MYNEQFTKIHSGQDIHLKPGQSFSAYFDGKGLTLADRLFMTGETALFYQWKNEPDYPLLYRYIDDALNTQEADKHQYCMNFSAEYYGYPKVAFHKIMFPPVLSYLPLVDYSDNWSMGISAKAESLHIATGGYLHLVFEVRYKRDDIDPHSTFIAPDEIYTIDIPQGTYDWQYLQKDFVIETNNVASVCCILEGENYSGTVFFEGPAFISENGYNILTDFAPFAGEKHQFNWLGQNLSKKEWPEFEIMLNGKVIYRGELFERVHRYSENEIMIPQGSILAGDNKLTIKLISNYRDALAYNIHEIGLISHDDSFVIAVPEIIHAGEPFGVLIKTPREQATVRYQIGKQSGSMVFEKVGLNVLKLPGLEPGINIQMILKCCGKEETYIIDRCVLHAKDGVSTGTADIIYINQNERSFDDYICWYFSNNIGNLFTIRHSYRWNGTRTVNDSLWYKTSALLNDLDVFYAHMLDGRELPGIDANPTLQSLDGPYFLGRQKHERDGAICYWPVKDITGNFNEEMYADMCQRMAIKRPENIGPDAESKDHFFKNGKHIVYRDPSIPDDMESAADFVVNQLALTRGNAIRHTGPTVLFKYFYQAGYKWTGAELMYGPTELIAAALRGAAELYGGPIGSHLAVQWSSTPHNTEERYKRYRLALYICYIQGIHEINTEEGLWHLEEYYNYYHRFSDACNMHKLQQQDFFKYVTSHSRTGKFYAPIGFISGRYDGWCCFGRGNVWGKPNFSFSDAEKGWDILKFFYPLSVLDALYIHGCTNEPKGFYTGTPNGNVDIVPIESEDFSQYRLLIAPGYNKTVECDMEKFQSYVENGGKLIIGWPQLSITTDRKEMTSYQHRYIEHPFANIIADKNCFVSDTYKGKALTVSCHNVKYPVLLYTDSGRPLVYSVEIGTGCVYFVNAREYAGNEAVYQVYMDLLELTVSDCLSSEGVYGQGAHNVQFTVFNQNNDEKHIYFLATDWYNDSQDARLGYLILNGNCYTVEVLFGQLVKIVCYGETAVWPLRDCNEVISNNGKTVKVQGVGIAEFIVASNGKQEKITIDFTEGCIQEFAI